MANYMSTKEKLNKMIILKIVTDVDQKTKNKPMRYAQNNGRKCRWASGWWTHRWSEVRHWNFIIKDTIFPIKNKRFSHKWNNLVREMNLFAQSFFNLSFYNKILRTLLEIRPADCQGLSDETSFKYRNDASFPGSIQSKIANLRVIPFFVRLKLDLIKNFQVSYQVNLMEININLSTKTPTGTEKLSFWRKILKKRRRTSKMTNFLSCVSKNTPNITYPQYVSTIYSYMILNLTNTLVENKNIVLECDNVSFKNDELPSLFQMTNPKIAQYVSFK